MVKRIKKLIIIFIIIIAVVYFLITNLFPTILFSNIYETENLTYYYNTLASYGIDTEEELDGFYQMCNEVAEEAKNNPFYYEKKIKILFCNSHGLFTFLNPTASDALGTTRTFFNRSFITFTKTDLSRMVLLSSAKENNQRNVRTSLLHELTHSYLTKITPIFNRITIPMWKEEGVCEVVSSDSSYNINEGIKRLISKQPDSSNSYKYFTYRMCVLYMMKHDGLSFEDVINDKRKQKEILSELYSLSETELKKLLE